MRIDHGSLISLAGRLSRGGADEIRQAYCFADSFVPSEITDRRFRGEAVLAMTRLESFAVSTVVRRTNVRALTSLLESGEGNHRAQPCGCADDRPRRLSSDVSPVGERSASLRRSRLSDGVWARDSGRLVACGSPTEQGTNPLQHQSERTHDLCTVFAFIHPCQTRLGATLSSQ